MLVPSNPLPIWLTLSVVTLPLVWAIGCAALDDSSELSRSDEPPDARRCPAAFSLPHSKKILAPAVGIAIWIVLLHCCSLICGTIVWGTVAADVVLIVWLGLYLHSSGRTIRELISDKVTGKLPRIFWLTVIISTGLVAPGILRFNLHDETLPLGHMSIIAQMQNGVYPPHHLQFPTDELRYHYGFDLLGCWVTAVFRLRIDRAIDLVTIASWFYSSALLWYFGDRFFKKHRLTGSVTVFVVLFGGGLPWLWGTCATLSETLFSLCSHPSGGMNPPLISFFMQHPWTVGIPLAVAILSLLPRILAGELRTTNLVALSFLLLALAVSQMVLFLSITATITICCAAPAAWGGMRASRPMRFRILLALAGVAWLASNLHCMFLPPYDQGSVGIILRDFSRTPPALLAWWDFCNFGMLLLLGIAALLLSRSPLRLPLVILSFGSLAIFNTFEYRYSWDICKFGAQASFGLGLLASLAVAEISASAKGRLQGILIGVLLIMATHAGIGYAVALSFRITGSRYDSSFFAELPVPTLSDVKAIRWLRDNLPPDELLYLPEPLVTVYSIWGGIPTPWLGVMERSLTFSYATIHFRRRLMDSRPSEAALYRQQGISWFLVENGDSHMKEITEEWIKNGEALLVTRISYFDIVRLKG